MKSVTSWGKKNIINKITIMIVFLFIIFLNINVGYITDDWHFKFIFKDFEPTGNDVRIRSISDVIIGAKNYYMLSGGRAFAHGLVFFVQMFDKWIFNIINSIMFVLLGYFMYLLVPNKKWREYWFGLPITYISVFLFSYSFGDSVLWISGSINYLWMAVLSLGTILYFNKVYKQNSILSVIICCVLFFLSSLSNENTGGMLVIILFLQVVEEWKKERNMPHKLVYYGVAILIGMAIVLMAPGNVNRANVINKGFEDHKYMLDCIINWCMILVRCFWLPIVLSLYMFFLMVRKDSFLMVICKSRYLLAGVAGVVVLGFSNTVVPRASFIPSIYLIIAGLNGVVSVIIYANSYSEKQKKERAWFIGMITVISALYYLLSLGLNIMMVNIIEAVSLKGLLSGLLFLEAISLIYIIYPYLKDITVVSLIVKCLKNPIALIITVYFALNMISNAKVFIENKNRQENYEKHIFTMVMNGVEDSTSLSFSFKDSDFWPVESRYSIDYTYKWMSTYYEWKSNNNK